MLNTNLSQCHDDLIFRRFVTGPMQQDQHVRSLPRTANTTKLLLCEKALKSKNSTFHDLKVKFEVQSEQLKNVTSKHVDCTQNLTEHREEVQDKKLKIEELEEKITKLENEVVAHKAKFDERTSKMVEVVRGMQHHLACLRTEENCLAEAAHYITFPIGYVDLICTYELLDGQEVFGLETCSFLGDRLWGHLELNVFIASNPWTASVLAILIIFSIIGMITFLSALLYLIFRHRRFLSKCFRRGGQQPRRPSVASPEGHSGSTEIRSEIRPIKSAVQKKEDGSSKIKDPLDAAWNQPPSVS